MAEPNPFNTTPLTAALHEAVSAARRTMEARGFDVRGLVVVADASHPEAPEYLRSAAAFPMDAWGAHAELLSEGVKVFERGARATLDGKLRPSSDN